MLEATRWRPILPLEAHTVIARIGLYFAAFGLLFPAAASGQGRDTGHFQLSQSDVEDLRYDARGRLESRTLTHYTADGELRGTTTTLNDYDLNGRLASALTKRVDADGNLRSTRDRRWVYGADNKVKRVTLRFLNAADEVYRTEVSVWDHDAETSMVTIETTVRDGEYLLLETRYSILTYRKRQLQTTDTSAYNPDGVQKWRHYSDWHPEKRGKLIERWHFDGRDEVERHEVEVRRLNERRQLLEASATIKNGRGALIETKEQVWERAGAKGQVQAHTTTWYDSTELATKRRTVSHAYRPAGSLDTRRIRWESWTE